MASQSSFDIVSQVDLQEVSNAISQALKEILARYDFKGIKTTIELDQKEKTVTVHTGNEFHLKSAVDVLQNKFVKRSVPLKALKYGTVEAAAGGTARQVITLQVGLDKEQAKQVVKLIKETGLRLQSQIMEDQVRVTGKDKDDLQQIIQMLRDRDLPFATQFVNYR
jgi:uncharacterized protein YajQ (UPF0234 family)